MLVRVLRALGLAALLGAGALSANASDEATVNAIIRSLAPIAGQSAPPPGGLQDILPGGTTVILPPSVVQRPIEIIIDQGPIILDYRYSLDFAVYFPFDSAFLTPQARSELTALGFALQSPALAGNRYLIAGHTDARGPADYNLDLSYRRAWAVKRFLMSNFGIPSWRLVAIGWGERYLRDPLNPYDAVNRRVEVTLIDTTIEPLVPDHGGGPAVAPPRISSSYIPPLPPCPLDVVGLPGAGLPDLDDFSPEPGLDCNPALPRAGTVTVQPDGRVIIQD